VDDPICQENFFKSEDCFQQTLCKNNWDEALSCIKKKNPEKCRTEINLSRKCKDHFFNSIVTDKMKHHLKKMAEIRESCEEQVAKYLNCVKQLGDYYPECIDRFLLQQNFIYSKLLPINLWTNYTTCYNKLGKNNESGVLLACDEELEEIRLSLDTYSEPILKSSGFTNTDIKNYGGANELLFFLIPILYSSHTDKILKDYNPRID